MQGLVNFAQQLALIFGVLLPTFLYCSAIGLFLFAAWGLWQQAQPHNPFRGKPWVPWLALLVSGACASFPTILTEVVTAQVACTGSAYAQFRDQVIWVCGECLQDIPALLSRGREHRADDPEVLGSLRGAKSA